LALKCRTSTGKRIALREILEAQEFMGLLEQVDAAMGGDLARADSVRIWLRCPHLLIAGSTGTGKTFSSLLMMSIICTRPRPTTLKMVLVDPKRAELNLYEGIPPPDLLRL